MELPSSSREALDRATTCASQHDLQGMIFAYAEADFSVREHQALRQKVFETYQTIALPAYQHAVQTEIACLERHLQRGETREALRSLSWITFYCKQAHMGAHLVEPTITRLMKTFSCK